MRSICFLPLLMIGTACMSTAGSNKLDEVLPPSQQQAMLEADVILVGEQHDNPHHHELQRQIIEVLGRKSQLGSVVFEQVDWDQQSILSGLNNRSLGRLRQDLQWEKSGWPDFQLYEPLFTAATRYRARVIGGNVTAKKSKAVYQEGYAAVFRPDEQSKLGLREDLPELALARLEQEIFEGHCQMLPKDHVKTMIPVQRTRDAAMALAWHRLHGQGKTVFIVGAGHARKDFGIPWYLMKLRPELKIFSIGLSESGSAIDAAAYDQVIRTEPVDRGDPCAELKEKWRKDPKKSSE